MPKDLPSTPHRAEISFDNPHSRGVFKKRSALADIKMKVKR